MQAAKQSHTLQSCQYTMSGATGELASLSRVLLSVNTVEGDAGF